MSHILLVEDDALLGEGLSDFLREQGFSCRWVRRLTEVEPCWYQADLVVLDRQMPEGDSVSWLPGWLTKKALPVILLTAKTEIEQRVEGLGAGAKDYVIKPFSHQELLARIQAQLRPLGEVEIRYKDLFVSLSGQRVKYGEVTVPLKPKEFQLLALLIQNQNRVYHRDELLNRVWGFQAFPSTRTVDNHILHLRQKLPSLDIETVRSVGYRLKGTDS
ncbi:response regulator transcription factor [Photobacterium sp. 1_MG-2023]|uniref:response regulator transcription factor n=1 Tax=Photobacterium sp. 1_MG-2023 TaxID=3062646 RepID=UPI0026E36FAA|nr:response regulator transcription factor [Photobacterium sp. 1_MG-2023]MDO6708177.1 response regulator transcription factor [Photobacterium sp. 1_MG-2023]